MKQALIVIDVQESFRKRPYWRGEELPAFLKNVQSLIDRANARLHSNLDVGMKPREFREPRDQPCRRE